jgi:NADH dehydrogenase [ubiquinone] 1 alpha subcomplex assembly factor 6
MATIPGYVKEVSRKTPVPERRSTNADRLSPVAALVRRRDRDRFQTVLFAPAARREALFALYAFNYEIARVRESVTQPMLGQIRLQWWRENVATAFEGGPIRHHPVAEALAAVIGEFRVTRNYFDRLVDARETDLADEAPTSLAALEDYAEASSATLVWLALEVLGVRDSAASDAARHIGIAYALAGLLRLLPFRTHPIIPAGMWMQTGVGELSAAASRHLDAARIHRKAIPRPAIPALLPAVIAQRFLARLRRAGGDAFDPVLLDPDPLQSWRLAAAAVLNRF